MCGWGQGAGVLELGNLMKRALGLRIFISTDSEHSLFLV
jgi:hypothetical protein